MQGLITKSTKEVSSKNLILPEKLNSALRQQKLFASKALAAIKKSFTSFNSVSTQQNKRSIFSFPFCTALQLIFFCSHLNILQECHTLPPPPTWVPPKKNKRKPAPDSHTNQRIDVKLLFLTFLSYFFILFRYHNRRVKRYKENRNDFIFNFVQKLSSTLFHPLLPQITFDA